MNMDQPISSVKILSGSCRGQVIVELLIAFGLASVLIPALLIGLIAARGGKVQQEQRITALGLLREGEEAVRSVREADWNNITSPAVVMTTSPLLPYYYHPVENGSTWSLSEGGEDVGDFTRSVIFEDIDPPDPSLKKVTVTVSWGNILPTKVSSTFFLTRWKNLTSVLDAGGRLMGLGFGDWCTPIASVTNVDLNRQGHPTTIKAILWADGLSNRVLAGTGANSSGPAFTNIKIQGNSPPIATVLGDYNGTPQIKVNGMAGETNYVFLATDARGVVILDISTTPYTEIGSFNPAGMKPVNDVFVLGNTGYAVTSDKFYVFNVSVDRRATSQVGVPLSLANGAKVIVDANAQYAYVPNPDPDGEFKIIDIHSHPTNLSQADIKNVNLDSGAGRDVFINNDATRAYVATAVSPTQPEFFMINISDKSNPTLIPNGTYETNGMDPYGVTVVSGDRAIIVGTGGNEYQVFSIEGDHVSFCPNHDQGTDFLNIDEGVYAVSSVFQPDGHAYSYIATGNAAAELKIIEGGAGSGSGGNGGVFESGILDVGRSAIFNRFIEVEKTPETITASYQVAVSSDCINFNYVGDYDSSGGLIPLSINPGQCFRFKVAFTNGGGAATASAVIRVNYSP
jgi:type II secretory pathway pseudopilin PulG